MKRTVTSIQKTGSGSEPADAINRHLGDRVKHLRAARDCSLESLANASGVSRSMLSQIEREQMPGAASAVTVIRANGHTYHYRSDKDCRIRTLSPWNPEKDVEFYEMRLQRPKTRNSLNPSRISRYLTMMSGIGARRRICSRSHTLQRKEYTSC